MAAPMSNANLQQNLVKNRPPPEIILFNDPDNRKRRIKTDDTPTNESETIKNGEYSLKHHSLSLKKAKFEVRKFGINGFSKEEKEQAKMKLAIELGAKPLKKPAENYKVFMSQLKLARQAEIEQRDKNRFLGLKTKLTLKKKPKKRVRGLKCLIGKFQGGVQTIPNRIIKETNRKK